MKKLLILSLLSSAVLIQAMQQGQQQPAEQLVPFPDQESIPVQTNFSVKNIQLEHYVEDQIRQGQSLHKRLPNSDKYALHIAAVANPNGPIIQRCLEHGALPNELAADNLTPLHFACLYRAEDNVARLIRAGANVNAPDKDGRTPLHVICDATHDTLDSHKIGRRFAIVQALLKADAKVNAPDLADSKPLFYLATTYFMDANSYWNQKEVLEDESKLKIFLDSRMKLMDLLRSHGATVDPEILDTIRSKAGDDTGNYLIQFAAHLQEPTPKSGPISLLKEIFS